MLEYRNLRIMEHCYGNVFHSCTYEGASNCNEVGQSPTYSKWLNQVKTVYSYHQIYFLGPFVSLHNLIIYRKIVYNYQIDHVLHLIYLEEENPLPKFYL